MRMPVTPDSFRKCEAMAMLSSLWSSFMCPHTGAEKAATGSGEAARYCSPVICG
jgi:hypothetical protein